MGVASLKDIDGDSTSFMLSVVPTKNFIWVDTVLNLICTESILPDAKADDFYRVIPTTAGKADASNQERVWKQNLKGSSKIANRFGKDVRVI
jgi:hypothetical protein